MYLLNIITNYIKVEFLINRRFTHHIGGSAERLIQQAFDREPFDRAILVIAQTMVILRKQVPGQSVVRDLNPQIIVNANKMERRSLNVPEAPRGLIQMLKDAR